MTRRSFERSCYEQKTFSEERSPLYSAYSSSCRNGYAERIHHDFFFFAFISVTTANVVAFYFVCVVDARYLCV